MARKKKNKISVGGNIPRPGLPSPTTIVLTQPKRFGIDISNYTAAVRATENVDYSRRYKLYDLYGDILMDAHLASVIEKRMLAVTSSDIEFRRDGKPDEAINEQIGSPWFRSAVRDIMDAQFWGFSLLQFYRKGPWISYDLVPRKHADPVRRLILRRQTDITGTSWDEYADLLFVGSKDGLGLLAKAAPWVIYKRNTVADWSQFSEVFGMPIREFIYDTDDDDARRRCEEDAQGAGSLAVLIHAADSKVNLLESGNKTGSAELYERLCERCNSEISKLVLGNTLTTEASDNGTQSLGTVHKKVEDKVMMADRRYLLDVLNYEMADIFLSMGINTEGGKFCFADANATDVNELQAKANILSQLHNTFNLPIDDDSLYNTFSGIVEKPGDYKRMKGQAKEGEGNGGGQEPGKRAKEPAADEKKSFANRLRGFFARAPHGGAALEW
jgi:phage gp29-like protein